MQHANPFSHLDPIELETTPKVAGSFDRCVGIERTHALISDLRKRYGITRIADTTLLDRTGIPTISSIVPCSADLISVYNGKGRTIEAATVSAVMEAVERQAAASPQLPTVRLSVRTLAQYLDLDALDLRDEARELDTAAVAATDLISGDVIPVPLATVQCPWFGERLFQVTSSNGLASGNTLVEAIYHALTEIVERHLWSLFFVRSELVPRFFLGAEARDVAKAREIRIPTGDPILDGLIERIDQAGLDIRLLLLEEPGLPVVVLGSLTEPDADPPLAHSGLGCSLSPRHAAERALTECVQSRVVDIQAAREDILRHDEPEGILGGHARRQMSLPKGRWYFDLPAEVVDIDAIPDRSGDDIAVDVRTILEGMRNHGMAQVAAVDLSPSDLPIAIVRIIVPAAETATIDGRIGQIARREFNPFHVRALGR